MAKPNPVEQARLDALQKKPADPLFVKPMWPVDGDEPPVNVMQCAEVLSHAVVVSLRSMVGSSAEDRYAVLGRFIYGCCNQAADPPQMAALLRSIADKIAALPPRGVVAPPAILSLPDDEGKAA